MIDMKKKEEFQNIGQAIRDLLNSYNLSNRFDEATLLASWERIVGKPLARRTKKVYMRNKVLVVEFDSPTIRKDFEFHKDEVLAVFRKEFGENLITGIIAI